MGLFDKFKRKIPPMVQVFYNQDFGFLIVPNAVEKTMGCHISIEPTEKVMKNYSIYLFKPVYTNLSIPCPIS